MGYKLTEVTEWLKDIRDHVLDDMAREMTEFALIVLDHGDAERMSAAIRILEELEERGKRNQ